MSQVSIVKRLPFTTQEDINIIRYIIDGGHYQIVSGNKIWKKMASQKEFSHRTFESLKNRFKKNILGNPRRPELGLDENDIVVLRMCRPPEQKTEAFVEPRVKRIRPDDFTSEQLNMDWSPDESDGSDDIIDKQMEIKEPQKVAKESPKKPTHQEIEYKDEIKRDDPVEVETDATPDVSGEEEMDGSTMFKSRLLWDPKKKNESWCNLDASSDQE